MKLISLFATFLALSLGFMVFTYPVQAAGYTGCGGGCTSSAQCRAGLSCHPVERKCGTYYAACSGARCRSTEGFDIVACNTPAQCAPSGSLKSVSYSACSVTCGPGTKTCDCGSENNCTVTCSGGVACGDTTACCVNQAPQVQPSAVTCTQVGTSISAKVDWTFADTGSSCGQSWGYNCSGNSNSFQLRFSGGKSNENALSSDATLTTGNFPDWGTYTVQVCALNGVNENCSATTDCVLTAPPCSTSGQTMDILPPNPTCKNTDPGLSASLASGADEMQFLVKQGSSTLSAPYAQQSAWLSTNPANYTPSLTTGAYYWNTVSRSTAAPVACVTPAVFPTGFPLNIDKTAPSTPVGAFTGFVPDATCLSRYFVTYAWGASSDVGCGGLAALPYQAQIASDAGYSTLTDNINTASLSITSAASYLPATTLYGRVSAQDSMGNNSGWSAGTNVVIPQPSPFPTIHIQGNYIEDTGVCNNMTIDPNNLSLALNIVPATGTTSVCTKGVSSYGCDITVDNQTAVCAVANHNVSLVASYAGYSALEWRVGNVCAGAVNPAIAIDMSSPPASPITANTYFTYDKTQGWAKTATTSFNNKATAVRSNIIPNNPLPFDSDDSANKYFISGEAGAVLKSGTLELGSNAKVGSERTYSANNWYNDNYQAATIFTPSKFTDYVKSRKKYKTITNTTEITEDGIYYVEGNLTINGSAVFDNRKVVIVADKGIVTIESNITPVLSALAIIADKVVINDNVTEVDGIIIGNNVFVNNSTTFTNKLKINGNLIQTSNTISFVNTRVVANAQYPSLFIKLNHAMYLDLLPYLSISLYDWKQIQ